MHIYPYALQVQQQPGQYYNNSHLINNNTNNSNHLINNQIRAPIVRHGIPNQGKIEVAVLFIVIVDTDVVIVIVILAVIFIVIVIIIIFVVFIVVIIFIVMVSIIIYLYQR